MVAFKKFFFFCSIFLFIQNNLLALSVGSNTVPSVELHKNFPSADSDNDIKAFAWMKNGFTLEDGTTTCTFGSVFPISGSMSLHGGQLYLNSDLIFENGSSLDTPGLFRANNYCIDFSKSITGFPKINDTSFHDATVFINSDLTINGTIKFRGDCLIDARKNILQFGTDGHILVEEGSTLHLRNIELSNISGDKIYCVDDSGKLILDNMRWVQDAAYSFSNGSIKFVNDVIFVKPYDFVYASKLTSTIDIDSMWSVLGYGSLTIGRATGVDGREPLYFASKISSILNLENCTFNVTSSGMQFTRGTMYGDGEIIFNISSTSTSDGLSVGDGTSDGDFTVKLKPESAVILKTGHLVYDVVNVKNFLTNEIPVKFEHLAAGNFYSKQDIRFENVTIKKDLTPNSSMLEGKKIFFSEARFNLPIVDFYITGTWVNPVTNLLNGDGVIHIFDGVYPLGTNVDNTNNVIEGRGNILGSIVLLNGGVELTCDFIGEVQNDIAMNGGKISLLADLELAKDVVVTDSGTIDLSNKILSINLKDKTWTSTVTVISDYGGVSFDSNISLASELTLSGNVLIFGNGNILDLKTAGQIVVEENSEVTFKNIKLKNLSKNKIICRNNSSKIVFDDVQLILDNYYTFSVGTITFVDLVDLVGTSSFTYDSQFTSTISEQSRFRVLNGASFAVGKKSTIWK